MSLLFETIRIENGSIMHPEEHEERMTRSLAALFGAARPVSLHQIIRIPREYSSGTIRCRVDYGKQIDNIHFTHYRRRRLLKFQVVINDEIVYPFKYSDRSALESMLMKKKAADEIMLVKHGLVTDTSYSNLIFYDGKNWITPSGPLLNGTCRERLIREGRITEREIFLKDLGSFRGFKIINAMNYPEDTDMIPVNACILP